MKRVLWLRSLIALTTLFVLILCQETWTLAGVTGNLSGTIKDANGAPVAGAHVQAVGPSETRSATTDATGHFVILSLAPDTYTVSLSLQGYQSVSFPGVTIFADQTQNVAYTMVKALKTIATVTSQASSSLVRSGVGSDLYSVNSAQASAAAALGGGGNLNNAYSAMASVPGVQTSMGGMGWNYNAAYVRGQNSFYTGFEYDGIPVNRAFDNYNSSTESSLGLQELQVYTGGGPASIASAGTAGFINQVIKTGTFPGFATANLGVGYPAFYHQASVEFGGSTPDRTFSYYVGLSGYNQTYNFLDNSNGAGYMTPGGIYSGPAAVSFGIAYVCTTPNCQGVKPSCPILAPPDNLSGAGCWTYFSGLTGAPQQISSRENVINLHLGIPKHNGLRDDVQLMWSGSALNNYFYQSPNDVGTTYQQFSWGLFHGPYAPPTCGQRTIVAWASLSTNACDLTTNGGSTPAGFYLGYGDNIAYNVAFGAPIARSASSFKPPGLYFAPDTPAHAFNGPIPLFDNDINTILNNTGITKLQYTYALSQSAYLRAYGYTFYSNWLQNGPLFGATDQAVFSPSAAQYLLITHTSGGSLSFNDQINDQNLIDLSGNYTSASVTRFSNNSAYAVCLSGSGCSPIGYMAKTGNGFTCYDPTTGKAEICLSSGYYDVATKSQVTPTWVSNAATGPTNWPNSFAPAGSPAARAGATWDSLWAGNATGSYNTVGPRFTNVSLGDQYRPSDKLLFNAAIRYDNFTYDMPQSANAADAFYANMTANYTCVFASNSQVLTVPLAPGGQPPAPAQYVNGDCNAAAAALFPNGPRTGWVHPNGKPQDGVAAPNFTASSPSSYSLDYWQPRFSATYTLSPDTVIRGSAGRFTQPPISASVQYLSLTGDDRSIWNSTMNLGFFSPFHAIPGISSDQYDLSLEHHFAGTDMSFKLTPFFTWISQWQQQTFIGSGFVTQVPVGANRDYGVELQFNKGDFTRNGLSGQFRLHLHQLKSPVPKRIALDRRRRSKHDHRAESSDPAVQLSYQRRRRRGLLSRTAAGLVQRQADRRRKHDLRRDREPLLQGRAAGAARSQRMVQPVHDRDRSKPELREHQLYLAGDRLVDSELAARQAGNHAELRVPNRRILRQPARYPRARSASLHAELGCHGHHQSLAKDQSAAVQLSRCQRPRYRTLWLPLHTQSADRNVCLARCISESVADRRQSAALVRRQPENSVDPAGRQPLPHVLRRVVGAVDGGKSSRLRRLRICGGRRLAQHHRLSQQLLQRHQHV